MRKTLLFAVLFLAATFSTALYAQETQDESEGSKKKSEKGVHPYKDEGWAEKNTNWSIMLEGGMAFIDGDFVQTNDFIPYTAIRPSGGIFLEYSFNPTWGIALGYNYANYGARPKDASKLPDYLSDKDRRYLIFGHMHSAELNLTFNFANAWFPNRSRNIFNMYFIAGAGVGFYKSYYFSATNSYEPQFSKLDYSTAPTTADEFAQYKRDNKYNATGLIDLGLALEFNVSRGLAIGLKGIYKVTMTDKIDTRIKGSNNDNIEYAALTLRWKVGATKKNHAKNYSSGGALMGMRAGKQEPQKDTIVINNVDTIYSSRIDTLVLVDKEVSTVQVVSKSTPDQRYYVYFDVDKHELNDQTLIGIQQFAGRLEEDTSLCVVLTGYCDHTGTEAYNEKLAQRRADAVYNELINIYGIQKDRLLAIGKGKLANVKKAYGPNRRVEMRFVSKEDLEKQRKEWEEKKQLKTEVTNKGQAQVKATSAKNDGVNSNINTELFDENSQWIDAVTTRRGMSLAKLARKYYNGTTDAWVYIYEANQLQIPNPDKLSEGLNLMIPRLTAEQLQPEVIEAKLKEVGK